MGVPSRQPRAAAASRAAPAGTPLAGTLADHLAAYGDRTALLGNGAGPGLTYADLAGRVRAFAARLGTTRRLVLVEGANHADALVAYLGAIEAGSPGAAHRPGGGARPSPRRTTRTSPGAATVACASTGPSRPPPCTPTSRCCCRTSGTTGSPKLVRLSARQRARQRRRDRRLPRAHARPTSRRRCCRCTTATACPWCTATCSRARACCSPRTRSSTRPFWEASRRHRRTSLAGRALHVRAARPGRVRRHGPAAPAVRHPGRGSARARGRASLRAPRARAGLGPLRHVRPDRGHRPDGLPAAAARRDRARHHRHPGRRRLVHHRAAARAPARRARRPRGRRARLPRPQRDARATRSPRPTWRSAGPSPSCAPATSATSARTGSSRWSAGAAGSPRSSACSPRPAAPRWSGCC